MRQIIQKGGLMADCAKLYINDKELANKFIQECATQCHNGALKGQWGEELIHCITLYAIRIAN